MAKEEIKNTDLTEEDEKKIDEIAEEMESAEGQWEYKLTKPVTFEGEQYDTLHFDFDKLTTEDALNIDDELAAKGSVSYMVEAFNPRFLMLMAVRACKEPLTEGAFKKDVHNGLLQDKKQSKKFFNTLSLKGLRRNCLIMAMNGYAPLDFWLKMPLVKFGRWIDEHNRLMKESEK